MLNKKIWIFGIILVFAINTAQASDWPMFGHDLAHTGTTDEVVEPPLELLWKYKTDGGIQSSPAVFSGVIYVGSGDGNLYALDAITGTLKWKFAAKGGSSPAIYNGVVFVGSDDHNIYAIDAINGSLKWKQISEDRISSSPAVFENVVYVGSHYGYLYAFDASNGAIKWKYLTGDMVSSSPAVSGGVVYIGSYDGNVYALNAANGELKWKYFMGSNVTLHSPAISGGILYIGGAHRGGNNDNLYALDISTGTLKWEYKSIGNIFTFPAISDNIVYVSSTDNNLYALNALTGTLKWKYTSEGSFYSSPAVSGRIIYVGSYDNNIYALDAFNGSLIWNYKTEYKFGSSPVVSGGIVYIGSLSGDMYAFKPSKSLPGMAQDIVNKISTSSGNSEVSSSKQNDTFSNNIKIVISIILFGIIIWAIKRFYLSPIESDHSSSVTNRKDIQQKESIETGSGLFEEGFNYSQEASAFFTSKNFKHALESYNKALTKFESTQNCPNIDTSLSTSIKNNKTSVQSNIVSCKLALGSSASEQGKTSLDKGDLNNAIKSYNNAKNYFDEALQDASVIKDEEKLRNAKELLSQTITNIENCYINIDRRKVEELSESSGLMLKESEEHRNNKELSKAREVLKNAENSIEEAFDISTRRGFNEAQRILSTLLKNVRDEKNVVDSLFMTPIDRVKTDHHVSTVHALKPEIRAANTICELQVLRGYSVLSNNDIKFGVRLTNNTNFVITDADVILYYAKNLFSMKDSEIQHLGNIMPNRAITATYLLKPRGCIHNEHISALITYKDHTGKTQTLQMHPKEVHCVCPFLKEKPMSEGEYSRLAASSEFVQEGISFKGISVEDLGKFMGETCKHMLHKVKEYDIEGKKVIYLSGESVGEKAYYLLTAVIQEYKGLTQVVLKAHSDKKYGLNGFMNEMAGSIRHLVGSVQNAREIGIIENTQVINIIDSVVQRTSFEMGESGSARVNIKDSVVQLSNLKDIEEK